MKISHKVIVIGDTGVGKSSMINHVIGKEVAKTGAIESVTDVAEAYSIDEIIEIVDTRGTDEVGTDTETWEQAFNDFLKHRPSLIIWCVAGQMRNKLDQHFKKFESLMEKAFIELRLDPPVLLIANKMDLIEPSGVEYLPESWPNLRTEKGKNINNKLNLLNSLYRDIVNSKLMALEPTCLEWYEGALPWNLDAIQQQLIETAKTQRAEVIRLLSLQPDTFEHVLAFHKAAVEKDIDNEPDENQKKIKKQWLDEYLNQTNHNLLPLKSFSNIPEEPLTRNTFLTQVLTFSPYVPLKSEACDYKLNEKAFATYVSELLCEHGCSRQEYKAFLKSYNSASKRLCPGFFTTKNMFAVAATIITGGTFMWWLAPAIGGAIGAALFGLKGAAAVSAGLAWLGLGSIAAGGFGMFGGTLVIVGAGSTLAGGISTAALKIIADNLAEESALMECTKVLQSFDIILRLIKEGKLRPEVALDTESYLASIIANLKYNKAPDTCNSARSKEYNKGLAIYQKAFELITSQRKAAKITYYREKSCKQQN